MVPQFTPEPIFDIALDGNLTLLIPGDSGAGLNP
jgi:hypothetical protein